MKKNFYGEKNKFQGHPKILKSPSVVRHFVVVVAVLKSILKKTKTRVYAGGGHLLAAVFSSAAMEKYENEFA